MDTKDRIVAALTEYDRRQSTRRGYNHYALGHYLGALQEAEKLVDDGQSWSDALPQVFCDRVLDVCLRAIR